MIDVPVGHDDEINTGGIERELPIVESIEFLVPLEHSAVDEKVRVSHLNLMTGTGDDPRRSVAGDFHILTIESKELVHKS